MLAQAGQRKTGSALRRIVLSDLATLRVPVPPLPEQRCIAALLDKADAIRRKRQQAIRLTDDLLRSAFLDMFGDIPAKRSRYPFGSVGGWVSARSGKSSKNVLSPEPTGIPVYGGNGPNGWATRALYEKPVIVVGRVGQQCAITHLTAGPAWITDNAIVVEVTDPQRLEPAYLATAWQHSAIRATVERLDLPFINQEMLLCYPVPLPPVDEQLRFVLVRGQILAARERNLLAGAASNHLFHSLVQRAFSGEL
jgi:type I restriction enzyme S subunit